MRIGVDFGGTKIEVAIIERDGREIARQRAPTPHGDYEGCVRAIAGLVRDVAAKTGATALSAWAYRARSRRRPAW